MNMHLQDVMVTAAGRVLVDVADLQLERGRPVTIVGESGSGKSLLAHAIMGTLPVELAVHGRLTMDGVLHDLADPAARRPLWGRAMSLLPQEPVLALDPTMRAGAQVAEGAAMFRTDRRGARTAAQRLLTTLGLSGEMQSFPHTLSGGMAQRVAFAAATIGGASVLIADEPSKGLDAGARDDLARLLRRHVDGGGVLLTITHDLDLARRLDGEVLVMKDASIVEQGAARQVLTDPTHPYTRRLLAAEPSGWAHPWMRSARPRDDARTVLVSGTGLAKAFGRKELFSGVDLTLHRGDRLALSGPSGSGKTTLGNVLLRLLAPDTGQVRHGELLTGGRVQKLYQDPALSFPARVALGVGLNDVVRRHGVEPGRIDGFLASLRLPSSLLQRRPGQVSGGELQRLAILRAMLLEPALVFADEPTSRLDLITQEETVRCLMDEAGRRDCAVLLVTHDEALAEAVADRRLSLAPQQTYAPTG